MHTSLTKYVFISIVECVLLKDNTAVLSLNGTHYVPLLIIMHQCNDLLIAQEVDSSTSPQPHFVNVKVLPLSTTYNAEQLQDTVLDQITSVLTS